MAQLFLNTNQTMKKLLLIPFVLMLFQTSFAQRIKIAYVDMEYILGKLPEYQSALKELENKAGQWKANIEKQAGEIKDLKDALEQEKVLLTKELLQEKEEEIAFKEKELLKYQLEKFGPEGDYVLQKQRLVTPVQDRVFGAVTKLIRSAKYDIVFDKSNDKLGLIYTSTKLDISDKILKLISKVRKYEERKKASKDRKNKRKQTQNEAKKKREALAAKRKKDREEKRKKALEERNKKKAEAKKESDKDSNKQEVEGKEGETNKKAETDNKTKTDNKNSSGKEKNTEEYGEKLTPEQLKKLQEKAPEPTPEQKAALRKKEREARRKRILEERKNKKKKNKNN